MCWLSPTDRSGWGCHGAPPDSPSGAGPGSHRYGHSTAASGAVIGPDSSVACPIRHSPGTFAGSKLGGLGPATRRQWRAGNGRASSPGHGTRRTGAFEIHVR